MAVSSSDIDRIDVTLSPPIDTAPRLFRPGTLLNAITFEKIQSNVFDNKDDADDMKDIELFNLANLYDEREQMITYLTQRIQITQPVNDVVAKLMMDELLNDTNENVSLLSPSSSVYPPVNRRGPVADHDRPFLEYGHLDRQTIASECQFNLECVHPTEANMVRRPVRMSSKYWAITAWTNVTKEIVMEEIKRQFGIENLHYACVAEEIGESNHHPHLHIQIILKQVVNKKIWFLDSITGTHCNYQVTRNDCAWNEYIKKNQKFIEFGSFKSAHRRQEKFWPSTTTTTTTTATRRVCSYSEEKRRYEKETALRAMQVAKTSVAKAMDMIQYAMPMQFLSHSSWYLTTFNYIHLRAQRNADLMINVEKEFIWPHSFQECTHALREAIDRWIRHHFIRAKQAKCLILIGPTGTGKTSFALSLPGRVNYFKGRWNLDKWSDYARYSVYDDIPWDDFSKLNYPNKKGLLTQNGKINVTDKYRSSTEINVRQPAIVLLNPEDTGTLLTTPTNTDQQQIAAYWKKRACVYVMNENEYFYKRQRSKKFDSNIDNDDNKNEKSSDSSIHSNEERFGDPNEFEQTRMYWEETDKKKKKKQ